MDLDPLPIEETLGIFRDSEKDRLVFKIHVFEEVSTKRSILAEASSIYDPLDHKCSGIVVSGYSLGQDAASANMERGIRLVRLTTIKYH